MIMSAGKELAKGLTMNRYPEIAHTLPPELFTKNHLQCGGKMCSVGHLADQFGGGSYSYHPISPIHQEATVAFCEEIVMSGDAKIYSSKETREERKKLVEDLKKYRAFDKLIEFAYYWNDHRKNSNENRSKTWNRFIARLGYTENA